MCTYKPYFHCFILKIYFNNQTVLIPHDFKASPVAFDDFSRWETIQYVLIFLPVGILNNDFLGG